MDLPPELRAALDQLLEGVRATELSPIAEAQSQAYRHRADDGLGRLLVRTELDALAYAAWRMPATFAAMTSALEALAELAPDFAPRSQLDLGSGPGTALHAADAVFGSLTHRTALEGAEAFRTCSQRIRDEAKGDDGEGDENGDGDRETTLLAADLATPGALDAVAIEDSTGFDLVTLGYVMGELPPEARGPLVERAWSLTRGAFVVVEPGTSGGHARLMDVRTRLLAAGAHLVAPCPHAAGCPLEPGDWCHFSVRVARSRTHRRVKGADLGWEDEKLAYLVFTRSPYAPATGRLLRPSSVGRAAVELDVCTAAGHTEHVTVPKRDRARFKKAKKLRWGDAVPRDTTEA